VCWLQVFAASQWYICTATNTWSQQTGSGGGSTATKLVDGGSNDALTVTQGTGTIVNNILVKNAPTTTGAEVQKAGSDTNIDMILRPKGTGTVIIPTTNMVVNANTPALLAIGGNTATGNSFGVAFNINLPAGGTSAEYIRFNQNGTWKASIQAGTFYGGSLCAGATTSGSSCTAEINNSQQAKVGMIGGFAVSSTTATNGATDVQ